MFSADNSTPFTFSFIGNYNSRSSNNCIYRIGVISVLVICVWVFFVYNKKSFQTENKDKVNKQPVKPAKQCIII